MIKGITVTLYDKTRAGEDAFGAATWSVTPVSVSNVLVGQPETNDIVQATELYGKKLDCWLGIPKGDTHTWEDTDVIFYGLRFRTIGKPTTGNQANTFHGSETGTCTISISFVVTPFLVKELKLLRGMKKNAKLQKNK